MGKEYRVHSVALLLVNDQEEFYCVQELQSKPEIGKIVGSKDYSPPWETREPGERLLRTIHRLIVEEIDSTDRIDITHPYEIGQLPVYDTLAYVYAARFLGGPTVLRGYHAGIEVEPLGWQPREVLLSRCRDGVPGILELWDKHKLDCQACR